MERRPLPRLPRRLSSALALLSLAPYAGAAVPEPGRAAVVAAPDAPKTVRFAAEAATNLLSPERFADWADFRHEPCDQRKETTR